MKIRESGEQINDELNIYPTSNSTKLVDIDCENRRIFMLKAKISNCRIVDKAISNY